MTFPERLKEFRTSNNLTQKEIGKAANISDRAYRNLELGVSIPNMDTLILLADFYNTSIDYLTCRTNDPTFNPTN